MNAAAAYGASIAGWSGYFWPECMAP